MPNVACQMLSIQNSLNEDMQVYLFFSVLYMCHMHTAARAILFLEPARSYIQQEELCPQFLSSESRDCDKAF